MKLILTLLTTLFICVVANCQTVTKDSVKVKVQKVKVNDTGIHYWLKNLENGDKYYTVCCDCQQIKLKGEIVNIARKDLIFEPFKK